MSLVREPEGVNLVVAEGHLDRRTLLEIAEWLNEYRRTHDQSAEASKALELIRRAAKEARTPSNS